jgi:hypothetical protein
VADVIMMMFFLELCCGGILFVETARWRSAI